MAEPIAASDETFEREVLGAPVPVLVEFWAVGCAPCRALEPLLRQIAAERAGRLAVVQVDVGASPRTAARYAVQGTPTLILFAAGRTVERIVGARPKAALLRQIEPYLHGAGIAG